MTIKSLKIKLAEKLLSRYKLQPVKTEEVRRLKVRDQVFPEWAEWFSSESPGEPFHANCVIFSMNRALQLHALLESYRLFAKPNFPVDILFKADSDSHLKAYQQVFELNKEIIRSVTEEKSPGDFETGLKKLISEMTGSHLFFLVDDIVFIRPVNLEPLLKLNPKKQIASLRMGTNLRVCYTHNKTMPLPEFSQLNEIPGLVTWKWKDGKLDWNYPLSVDGHLFSLEEMKILIRSVQFSKPNTFEDALQIFQSWFEFRSGVCFTLPCIVNNPANKVQTENKNRSGESNPEDLLRLWMQGFRINIQSLAGMTTESCHQEFEYPLVKREKQGD